MGIAAEFQITRIAVSAGIDTNQANNIPPMKCKVRLYCFCVWCTLLLASCIQKGVEYRIGDDGRFHNVGTFTPDESWKRLVNERIALEQAGDLQKGKSETTKQYWQNWYRGIRNHPTPSWTSSEFKTTEDMVAYIKQQRRAASLPTYD